LRKAYAGLLVGCIAAVIVLAVDLSFTRFTGGLHPLQAVELRTYDWRLSHTARPETARTDIALVEIDESSLRNLQATAGGWPWPRTVHSMLIDYLARAPAKVVAYDVLFTDPDTHSGFEFGGTTWSGAESDKALADSIKVAGNVLLLADAAYDTATPGAVVPDEGYRLESGGALEREGILPPLPALAQAAAGLGHNLFILDPDGPLRHMTPFVRAQQRVLPSLGMAAALRAAGIGAGEVRLDGTALHLGVRRMPLSWRTVEREGGALRHLWALIDFRGPALLDDLNASAPPNATAEIKSRMYPTYTFFDLLLSENQLLTKETPKVDPSIFRDKIVFVGTTASGLLDTFESPFGHGKMPGIQVHAAVADDILSNRFIRPASEWVRVVSVVAGALLVGMAAALLPAWWATLAAFAVMALMAWSATFLFTNGVWFNLTQPVLASWFALLGGVGYQYFFEDREKRRVKQLFGRYVSKDVYAVLMANPGLARLGGQRREMSVLFSDIRGFTTVTERGQPDEIVRMLNEYFSSMVDLVFKHGGTLDKFVGDMVMALYGAPLDDPDHADHAVQTALAMIAELGRLNARWKEEGRFSGLDIGIGINTGPMIAGNIGSEAIMSYTVIGDAVNLGSRLESLNKQFGTRIIISDATRQRLKGDYEFRPLGDVVVKGKTHPVAIFEVVGPAAGMASGINREARV
jgi:adenylate cyclase